MKWTLVDRKEYAELRDEVAQLRRLVDALCVGSADHNMDEEEQRVYLSAKGAARTHGYRTLRKLQARAKMRELKDLQQTLLEDYPGLTEEDLR